MAAITAVNLTSGSSGAPGSSVGTASVTPSANKLVLATVGWGFATTNTPTLSGNGITWVEVVKKRDNNHKIAVFRGMVASPTAGAITIDFAAETQNYVKWSVDEFTNMDTTGTNGSGAIVQTATNFIDSGANTGITVTLATFTDVNNATFGGTSNSETAVVTPGTGFTELSENNADSRTLEVEFKDTNDTTVDWTWASANNIVSAAALEMKNATQVAIAIAGGSAFFM